MTFESDQFESRGGEGGGKKIVMLRTRPERKREKKRKKLLFSCCSKRGISSDGSERKKYRNKNQIRLRRGGERNSLTVCARDMTQKGERGYKKVIERRKKEGGGVLSLVDYAEEPSFMYPRSISRDGGRGEEKKKGIWRDAATG